ncbi:MAG: hypothetical protein ACSHWZ_11070 [Sulfitobacter sp.]
MKIEITGLVALILGMAALFMPVSRAAALMALCTVLGTAAAISLPALGGASVLVPSVFMGFFALRVILAYGPGALSETLRPPGPGFWLLLVTLLGVFSAYFLPRLFAGSTETMSLSRTIGGRNFITLSPLRPSASNITQTFYALGGFACFAAAAAYSRAACAPQIFITIIILTAATNMALALADIVTFYSGTAWIMDVIRTADYALLTGMEKGGFKRISGSFSEASAFASYTAAVFACTASLWLDRAAVLWTGPLALACLIALTISTSATGVVGACVVLFWLVIRTLLAGLTRPAAARPLFLAIAALTAPLAVLQVLLFFPALAEEIAIFLDEILFSKTTSQSGIERGEWNAAALRTFWDTSGFGAGLGSARSSSFALTLLSNLGLAGFVLFAAFVLSLLRGETGWRGARDAQSLAAAQVARAGKAGCFAVLASAVLSGSVYDLGLLFYFLAGMVAGHCLPAQRRHPSPRFTFHLREPT